MNSKIKLIVKKLKQSELISIACIDDYVNIVNNTKGLVSSMEEMLANKKNILPYSVAIYLDGFIAGMIIVKLVSKNDTKEKYYDFFVYLKPQYRSKGIMSYMCCNKSAWFDKIYKLIDNSIPIITVVHKDAKHKGLLELFGMKFIKVIDDYFLYQLEP